MSFSKKFNAKSLLKNPGFWMAGAILGLGTMIVANISNMIKDAPANHAKGEARGDSVAKVEFNRLGYTIYKTINKASNMTGDYYDNEYLLMSKQDGKIVVGEVINDRNAGFSTSVRPLGPAPK